MGLLGKLTGADAAKKQAKSARKQAAQREGAALGELTPQAMQQLMQMFFSQYMAQLAPQLMASQQRLGAGAAGMNLGGAGLTRSLKAGLPGMYAQGALQQAIEPTMRTAENRAGIRMEKPIITNPARTGLTDLVDIALRYYSGGLASTGSLDQKAKTF